MSSFLERMDIMRQARESAEQEVGRSQEQVNEKLATVAVKLAHLLKIIRVVADEAILERVSTTSIRAEYQKWMAYRGIKSIFSNGKFVHTGGYEERGWVIENSPYNVMGNTSARVESTYSKGYLLTTDGLLGRYDVPIEILETAPDNVYYIYHSEYNEAPYNSILTPVSDFKSELNFEHLENKLASFAERNYLTIPSL